MSHQLFDRLDKKIDDVLETLDIFNLQVEELEEKNASLEQDILSLKQENALLQKENATLLNDNMALKTRQTQWEQSLTTLLGKLDEATDASLEQKTTHIEQYETEEAEA